VQFINLLFLFGIRRNCLKNGMLCIVPHCVLYSIMYRTQLCVVFCTPFCVAFCTPLCIVLHYVYPIVYCTPYMHCCVLNSIYELHKNSPYVFHSYMYCTVSVPHSKHYVYFILPYVLRFAMHCHVFCVVRCLPYVSGSGLSFRPDVTYRKSKGSGPCQRYDCLKSKPPKGK
jgi:hypothetical protein